jgi:acyl-CoA reductase-like NAD-dependent aldehyde dehydrogenase
VGGLILKYVSTHQVDQMPCGGVKSSGLGLDGVRSAIEELTDPKLIVLNLADPE